ncbi:hypothetical protein Q1695_006929 [Nippostrongylus brasiliensis]|nr:hypothetical protein Q1695_006929 [Nippostrongylus brasiliensis]
MVAAHNDRTIDSTYTMIIAFVRNAQIMEFAGTLSKVTENLPLASDVVSCGKRCQSSTGEESGNSGVKNCSENISDSYWVPLTGIGAFELHFRVGIRLVATHQGSSNTFRCDWLESEQYAEHNDHHLNEHILIRALRVYEDVDERLQGAQVGC